MATPAATPTPEEIERRVTDTDTARSTRRAAAARQVGALAARHATVAEQLADIERQLGEVLTDAADVVTLDELARFTDIPAPRLTEWRAAGQPHRTKRKKSTATDSRPQHDPPRAHRPVRPQPPAAVPVAAGVRGLDNALAP